MSDESRIDARKDGAIGWMIFNNPARRNGDKAFVSGADIAQFEKPQARLQGEMTCEL